MSQNLGARVGHDRVNPTDPDEHGPRRYKVRFDAVGRPVDEGAASGDRGVVEVEFKVSEGDLGRVMPSLRRTNISNTLPTFLSR